MVQWQFAVAGSASAPTPTGLFSVVDLEKAATDPDGAKEWATFLDRIEKAHVDMIAEAVAQGYGESVDVSNLRSQLGRIQSAHEHAAEHAAHWTRCTPVPGG